MSEPVLLTDSPKKYQRAVRVDGSWFDKEQGGYWFDPARNLDQTRKAMAMFPEIRASVPADIRADLARRFHMRMPNRATEWVGDRDAEDLLPNMDPDLRSKLYTYQRQDIAFAAARMRSNGGDFIGWDRGLGKTLGSIALISELRADNVIIICPNSSKEAVWAPEIAKWDTDQRFAGRVYNFYGSPKKRDAALAEWRETGGILLVHYEGLRLIPNPEKISGIDLIICDEAHRLSNGHGGHKAPLFYKALMKLKAKWRLALSGSVMVNSPEDIYGAAHWLFPEKYRSRWKDWNDKYLEYIEDPIGGRILIGVQYGKLDDMRSDLAAWMQVRTKEDELPGLPEKIEQDLYVDLSPAQRKVYDDLVEQFITLLPDGEILMAQNILAQLTKLRQVATGLDLVSDELTDSSKLDLAMELVNDNLPRKTVVFAWHRATVWAMSSRLEAAGIEHTTIGGDVKPALRGERVRAFQEDPDVKVMVATIKTLGESVTLHAASDLIFLESSWTPADMEQAADRVYRIGQERHVTITRILARDTVDVHSVLPRVASKADLRATLLGSHDA